MIVIKCFACDKITSRPRLVRCIDEQTVMVGSDCFRYIRDAKNKGYQPPLGGPKLFEISQVIWESADD